MCQATVYLIEKGQEKKEIKRDVVLLEPVEEGVRLHVFFEEAMTVPARIGRVDFLKHTVTLEPLEGRRDGDSDG